MQQPAAATAIARVHIQKQNTTANQAALPTKQDTGENSNVYFLCWLLAQLALLYISYPYWVSRWETLPPLPFTLRVPSFFSFQPGFIAPRCQTTLVFYTPAFHIHLHIRLHIHLHIQHYLTQHSIASFSPQHALLHSLVLQYSVCFLILRPV